MIKLASVRLWIEFCGQFTVCLGRDHVDSALIPYHVPDPVSVICFVREHVLTRLQVVEQRLARRCVMGLTGCQFISDRQAILIGKCMYFRS